MRDHDVRLAVRAQLESDHSGDLDTKIVEEMGIWSGSVRVDLAVINGELSGFELKSARDTLNRLPQQSALYSQVFDRMTIVTAENHLTGCLRTVPSWWGIVIASGEAGSLINLHAIRTSEDNSDQSPLQIARLLWRPEVLDLLCKFGISKGYRSKSAEILHQHLANELPLDLLKDEVRAKLKSRETWLG